MTASLQQARIEVVRQHMALECVQDWDGVLGTFEHPRYEMHGSGAVYDGSEAVMAYFESSRATFPDLTNEIICIAAAGDTVLVEFWLQGTHLGPLEARGKRYEPTGRRFRVRMAASFEFAPGSAKIICERPYTSVDSKLISLQLL
jgi:predicted SnoaL-like aldol condensation-catalyzing enzyme